MLSPTLDVYAMRELRRLELHAFQRYDGMQTLKSGVPRALNWEESVTTTATSANSTNKIREGNEVDLPDGTNLTGCGLGMIRI